MGAAASAPAGELPMELRPSRGWQNHPTFATSHTSKVGVLGGFCPCARESKNVFSFPAPGAEEGLLEKAGMDGQ